jgi:hypothetical protein
MTTETKAEFVIGARVIDPENDMGVGHVIDHGTTYVMCEWPDGCGSGSLIQPEIPNETVVLYDRA